MIEGSSRAGDETWFRVNPPGIAFDVGRGPLRLSGTADLFLTHGHLDHVAGLPFLLSHRAMQGGGTATRIHCPRPAASRIRRFVEAALDLEERASDFELHALEPGEQVRVGRDFRVEAFATDHPVPSLGYHLWRRRSRLAPELQGLAPQEIASLRRRGTEVAARYDELLVSYCGDTGSKVFETEPRLFEATVLVIETTYIGSDLRERAREFGHLHLEDLIAVEGRFRNRGIVLHHLSRRHRLEELRRAVDERLPALAERVHVWGSDS